GPLRRPEPGRYDDHDDHPRPRGGVAGRPLGANRRRTDPPVTRRHVRAHTQVLEALVGVSSRPGRLMLTLLGEALGLAALVATVSLAATANAQVAASFDQASARQVTVRPSESRAQQGATLPRGAERSIERLPDVVAAGSLTRLDLRDPTRSTTVIDPQGLPAPVLPVFAT